MSDFYIINVRKIFFPNFRGPPAPVSYAYAPRGMGAGERAGRGRRRGKSRLRGHS